MRSACVAVLLLALAATASPAMAKGPTEVRVSGPGVDTQLSYRHASGDVDVGTLAQAARVYDVLGRTRFAKAPDLGPAELGPSYVLGWAAGGSRLFVQTAYPFAEGGAWVRFGWGTGETGWLRAPGLTDQLVALGAVEETSPSPLVATTEETAAPDEPRASESRASESAGSSYGVVVPAGLALVVVLGVGALLARRRLSR